MRGRTLRAVATFENMAAPPPEGELTFVDNAVDATTGMIQLKAAFPNADNALWPGQYVHVTLTLSELTNAIVVPSQAVQTGQNGQFIYVVKTNPTNAASPVCGKSSGCHRHHVSGRNRCGKRIEGRRNRRDRRAIASRARRKSQRQGSGDSATNSAAN